MPGPPAPWHRWPCNPAWWPAPTWFRGLHRIADHGGKPALPRLAQRQCQRTPATTRLKSRFEILVPAATGVQRAVNKGAADVRRLLNDCGIPGKMNLVTSAATTELVF